MRITTATGLHFVVVLIIAGQWLVGLPVQLWRDFLRAKKMVNPQDPPLVRYLRDGLPD